MRTPDPDPGDILLGFAVELVQRMLNKRRFYDRSKDERLVSTEWITDPGLVFDNCLSVVRLSRTKVDASSTGFFTSDADGRLQHRTCLPVHIHVR